MSESHGKDFHAQGMFPDMTSGRIDHLGQVKQANKSKVRRDAANVLV
jgi:hypothetical protein